MKLLVKRDKTALVSTGGDVYGDYDFPDFLKGPKVVHPHMVQRIDMRDESDDLIIESAEDYADMGRHLQFDQSKGMWKVWLNIFEGKSLEKPELLAQTNDLIPAIWSGYRSVLTQDPKTGKLYRIKGVSFNPQDLRLSKYEDGVEIHGGQLKQNAYYERNMSHRFNQVLLNEGIDPIMQFEGLWKYGLYVDKKAKKAVRPTASIFEVKGDTRLDELMLVLEQGAMERMPKGRKRKDGKMVRTEYDGDTKSGNKFFKALQNFYWRVGFAVGGLKSLMDASGQTWSCDSERTNAHIGNIVLYREGNNLKVGLVDFDASCDLTELSQSQLEAIQKKELDNLAASTFTYGPISLRAIGGVLGGNEPWSMFDGSRISFVKGLEAGYHNAFSATPLSRSMFLGSNFLDLGDLQELFALLRRSPENFAYMNPEPGEVAADAEKLVSVYEKGLEKKIGSKIDLGQVIYRNRNLDDLWKSGKSLYLDQNPSKKYSAGIYAIPSYKNLIGDLYGLDSNDINYNQKNIIKKGKGYLDDYLENDLLMGSTKND